MIFSKILKQLYYKILYLYFFRGLLLKYNAIRQLLTNYLQQYQKSLQKSTRRRSHNKIINTKRINLFSQYYNTQKNIKMISDSEEMLQRPIVGVYPININSNHITTDGGSCKFEKMFIKQFYSDVYYVPGGQYLSFQQFNGGHQKWLDNFQLKKGLIYTMSCYLRTNNNLNSWNKGKGNISSDKAMFQMFCKKMVNGTLVVSNDTVLTILIENHTPQLQKYVSKPYKPEKDELVSIIINPWLYDRNGILWDFAYPEIQWRN